MVRCQDIWNLQYARNEERDSPLEMTLPSAHHSPRTVNKNAKEFVIGTVRLSSVFLTTQISDLAQIYPPRIHIYKLDVISETYQPVQSTRKTKRFP